jgi:predicted PurR-regulated permease PerM
MRMTMESRGWLGLALVAATGWLIYLLAPVITPFAIAAGIAYLGDPLVDRLERRRIRSWEMGRTLAVVLVFLLLTLLFALVLVVLLPLIIDQIKLLIEKFPSYIEWAEQEAWPWLAAQLGIPADAPSIEQLSAWGKDYWKEISGAAFQVAETLGRGGQAVITWLTNLVLIPVVAFYLMRDWDKLLSGIQDLLPRGMVDDVNRIAGEIDEVLGAFMRGQLVVMLALGVIYSTGLSLIGIDLAILIGMGAGLLSIVPYLGSIVGLLVAAGAALFQFHDVLHLLLVGVVFAAGQMAEGMVLTPKLVGDKIGLHPVAVIFAVLAGGQLFGFLGILLALPVTAALNVLVRHASARYRGSSVYARQEND